MKNFTTLFAACLLMLVSTISFAQSKSDFKGSWHGSDADGKYYELNFKADATCSLTVDGNDAYHITHYRIESIPPSALDDDVLTTVRNVIFQTSVHNSADNQASSFSGTGKSKFLIYHAELKLTDESFTNLQVTFKAEDNGEQLQFNLTR